MMSTYTIVPSQSHTYSIICLCCRKCLCFILLKH